MANQHTKKAASKLAPAFGPLDPHTPTERDPAFGHLLPGPSNEALAQKQAELEQLRKDLGYPKVEVVGLSQEEKDLDAWGDLDYDPLGTRDPLEALKRQHQKPGMALKLLSDTVVGRLGRRDYRIVKEANGDPVKFGTMTLGEIPERIAKRRREAVVQISNEELQTINNTTEQEIDRLRSEAKGMGLEILRPGEVVSKQGRDYQMGVSVERGEGPPEA